MIMFYSVLTVKGSDWLKAVPHFEVGSGVWTFLVSHLLTWRGHGYLMSIIVFTAIFPTVCLAGPHR